MDVKIIHAIKIYDQIPPGSENWTWSESQNDNNSVKTLVAFNVVEPSLTAYLPSSKNLNTPAVIICPGGGFHFLATDHEGSDLAKQLAQNGIAAFVLKYRTVPVNTDNPFDMFASTRTAAEWDKEATPYIPIAIEDGKEALRFLKTHAQEYRINSDKIGILGFSAGALVALGTTFSHEKICQPSFAASIYGDLRKEFFGRVTSELPALFLACAQDDDFGFIPVTLDVYNLWYSVGAPIEMHLFSKGGHGFGIGIPDNPASNWPQVFLTWLLSL